MISLFRKKPQFEDEAIYELALMLTLDDANPTYRREFLQSSDFDLSLDSLRKLDAYLAKVHEEQPQGNDAARIILRAGAYAGEVFRRNCPAEYHWLRYEEALKQVKSLKGWGKSIGTCYVLWKSPESLAFPMGKVAKFLENGAEDSTFSFASVLIDREQH